MVELAFSICLVESPLPSIPGSVSPDLSSGAVAHAVLHVALVNGPIFESQFLSVFQILAFDPLLEFRRHFDLSASYVADLQVGVSLSGPLL